MTPADPGPGPFRHLLALLLRPDRFRLRNALILVAGVSIMLVVWETFRLPDADIACYVILFMARPDRTSTVMGARLLAAAAVLGVLLAVLILVAGLSEPALRIGLMALATFAAMSFAKVPGIGLLFFGIGFLAVEALTAADSIAAIALSPGVYGNADTGPPQILFLPPEEALLHDVLWIMLAFATPCLLLMLLFTLFGVDPARLLRGGIADRLSLVERWCRAEPGAAARLEAQARLGSPDLVKLAGLAAKAHGAAEPAPRNEARIHATLRLMLCCVAAEWLRPGHRPPWAATIADGCAALRTGGPVDGEQPGDPIGAEASRMLRLLRDPGPAAAPEPGPPPAPGLLAAADFPYGFKVTLAVMICYVLNNALDWTAIGTSVTTCFVVALGTLGESGHKMVLRVCGCLFGGALGLGSVVFLMPLMTDIGDLLLLFAPVVFVAAWIACGSERIAYGGLQVALAFFVSVFDGFGPTTDLEGARNRLAGILLGITVTYLVSALVWPVRADRQAAARLAEALHALARLLRAGAAADRARAEREFAAAVLAAQALMRDEPLENQLDDGFAANDTLAARVQELVIPALMLTAAPEPDPAAAALATWLDEAAERMASGRFGRDGFPPAPDLPDGQAPLARQLLDRTFAHPAPVVRDVP